MMHGDPASDEDNAAYLKVGFWLGAASYVGLSFDTCRTRMSADEPYEPQTDILEACQFY